MRSDDFNLTIALHHFVRDWVFNFYWREARFFSPKPENVFHTKQKSDFLMDIKKSVIFSSPAGQRPCELLSSFGVCCTSKLSHLNLLWNHGTKLKKTLIELSLGGPLFKLYSTVPLYSRWWLLLKIEISLTVYCCFIISQIELKF